MIKRFFPLLIIMCAALAANAQTQITNGDFETWTYDGDNLPNSWNSFQTADGSLKSASYSSSNRQVKKSTEVRPGSKGSSSCAIWARSVFGIVAQGNITTGRVHAGSMTAANKDNYNYSDRDGSNTNNGITNPCAMKFTGKPDSIVVWAKFVPAKTLTDYPYAKFSAIIHNDNDYIAYGLDENDTETNMSYVVAKAVKMIETNEGAWQRISLPFEYTNNGAEPAYIQLNASTNSYPGKGTKDDYLYIDDVECVYNTTYTEPLYVTVNGLTTGPQDINVVMSEYSNDFTFNLKKFVLYSEDGDPMPVGDIVITGLTKDADGNFSYDGTLKLQENQELIDEYGQCLATLLGAIPLKLTGNVSSGKLAVTIDINLTDMMNQVINVHLGYDRAVMSVDGDAKYGTFCAPFKVTLPSGVSAYKITKQNGNSLQLSRMAVVPVGTPVVLYYENGDLNNEFFDIATVDGTSCTNGLLTGLYEGGTAPVGSYVLQNQDGKVGFYLVEDAPFAIGTNRCYLTATSTGAKSFFMEDAVDGIETVEAAGTDSNDIFDIAGRRVSNATKGVYIVNGKKILK